MSTLDNELKRLIKSHGLANVSHADLCDVAGIAPGSLASVIGCPLHEYLMRIAQAGTYGPAVPITKTRVHPDVMRLHLLTVALDIATHTRYRAVGRGQLSEIAGTTRQNVQRFFSPARALGDAILLEAIARGVVPVVAQGLTDRDPIARKASPELTERARAWIVANL
jgi:hypothetical protein